MASLSKRAHRLFYEPKARGFIFINDLLAILTLVSVLALILETVPSLEPYYWLFNLIEYVTVAFFTFEYIARIVAKHDDVGSYVFSFLGVIDLLAIIPTFLGFSNLTFLKTARVLRILRFLRMIRLAKVARFKPKRGRDLEDYGVVYRLNVGIYFFALFSATTVFGTLIYIAEGSDPNFSNIPLGMLWALKPLMGGVAQTEPATIFGQVIAVAARFTGLILFGLLLAIVGNAVKKFLFGTDKLEQAK